MQKKAFALIKVISTVLITSAIGLELWNVAVIITHNALPNSLNLFFWIGRFAMAIHVIEGGIAAVYAPSRKKPPIQYGVYTFFVGSVGLIALFDQENEQTIP